MIHWKISKAPIIYKCTSGSADKGKQSHISSLIGTNKNVYKKNQIREAVALNQNCLHRERCRPEKLNGLADICETLWLLEQ